MAWPPSVITREISFGKAVVLETSDDLSLSAVTRASRSLVSMGEGFRMETMSASFESADAGEEIIFPLPVTDQSGWMDPVTRKPIEVGPDQHSHLYTTTLTIRKGTAVVNTYKVGPYPVPQGVDPIDGDTMLVSDEAQPGVLITIPEAWQRIIDSASLIVNEGVEDAVRDLVDPKLVQMGVAVTAAESAASDAVEAKEAAQAVPAQVDEAMQGVLADPDSGFGADLNAAIGDLVQPVADTVVATAVAGEDIPGQASTAVTGAVVASDIPGVVATEAAAKVAAEVVEQVGPEVAAAQTARTGAETARTDAQTARTGAETARTGAEAARDLALAGQFAGTRLEEADLDTVINPGVYTQMNTSSASLENHYPIVNGGGILEVYELSTINGGRRMQRFTVQSGAADFMRGVYQRRQWEGKWTPWQFISTQRVDQTAGRAIYTWDDVNNREQLIYGDTGPRNIEDLLSPDFTGRAFTRRSGATVQVWGEITPADSVDVTSEVPILTQALPNGFNPSSVAWVRTPFRVSAGDKDVHFRVANPVHVRSFAGTWGSNTSARFLLSWMTTDTWPTILPGTASGSIPA